MEEIRITLPSHLTAFIKSEIAKGHYASDSEFIGAMLAAKQCETADWMPSDDSARRMIHASLTDARASISADAVDAAFTKKP